MNIIPDTEKVYVDFTFFGEKIISIHFLKKNDLFIDIGIIYPEIILKTDNINFLTKNKKSFENYLKILSLKEVNTPGIEEFFKNPSLFGNYILLVKENIEIKKIIDNIFKGDKKISLYLYDKNLRKIEKFISLFSEKIKERMRIIDTINIISSIQYNTLDIKARLTLLKNSILGEI